MKPILTLLILVFLSGTAFAQEAPLSVEGLALRNARLLVAGVAFGLGTYDSALGAEARLYCAPADVDVSGNTLWALADEELDGDHDLATVAETALEKLRALYPCP